MIKRRKSRSKEKIIALLLFWPMTQLLISNGFQIVGIIPGSWLNLIYRGAFVYFLVYFLYHRIKMKLYTDELLFIFSALAVFAISFAVYFNVLKNFGATLFVELATSLIIIMALNSTNDLPALLEYSVPYQYLSVLLSVTELIVYRRLFRYDMTYSYMCVLPTLCALVTYLAHRKGRFLFIAALNVLVTMYAGSRGAILCYIVFFLLLVAFYYRKNKKVRRFMVFGLVLLGIFIVFGPQIVDFLVKKNVISRNLSLMISGKIISGSGREDFYGLILGQMKINPFAFRGFYADRLFISNYFNDPSNIRGYYVHNFFLEIFYHFGFSAIIFLVLALLYVFKANEIVKHHADKQLGYVYIISLAAFSQLLISSSYLTSPFFGIGIGVLFAVNHQKYRFNVIGYLSRQI